jgi:hypothetical protein
MVASDMASSRIRWLVVAHAILIAAPLLTLTFAGSLRMWNPRILPLEWALVSLPIGSLMTLSVWMGLGRTRLRWRLALGLAALLYISILSIIDEVLRLQEIPSISELVTIYLQNTGELAALLLLLSGAFLLIRRRFVLTRIDPNTQLQASGRLRFSMFQVMLLMSVVAILLSLLRAVRASMGHRPLVWESVMTFSFMFLAFMVNTVCAAFATLGSHRVKRNVAMVIVVASLLGVMMGIAMRTDVADWWLFAGSMGIAIVPTVVVLVSLLVVRSCDYRLIRPSEAAVGRRRKAGKKL